jgi:hypothetical protein
MEVFLFCFLYDAYLAASLTNWSLIERSSAGCACVWVCLILKPQNEAT